MRRLIVEGLGVRRGGRRVFSGLSFALAAGEAIAVVGPNGAGKSTLLMAVAGLLAADEGTIRIDGGPPEAPVAESCALLGHRDGLKPALCVREALDFWASQLRGPEGGLDSATALAAFGLAHAEELPIAHLSAGQRRRVALARLLVARRALWLLDEPATALDAAARERLSAAMANHLAVGGAILAATHEPLGVPARGLRLAEAP